MHKTHSFITPDFLNTCSALTYGKFLSKKAVEKPIANSPSAFKLAMFCGLHPAIEVLSCLRRGELNKIIQI